MKKFYSFFLAALLILPTIVSFAHHVFEDHKICTESEIHFHQDEINCSTCFLLSNTDNSFNVYTEFSFSLVLIYELVIVLYENHKSNSLRTFNLRAPPVV